MEEANGRRETALSEAHDFLEHWGAVLSATGAPHQVPSFIEAAEHLRARLTAIDPSLAVSDIASDIEHTS